MAMLVGRVVIVCKGTMAVSDICMLFSQAARAVTAARVSMRTRIGPRTRTRCRVFRVVVCMTLVVRPLFGDMAMMWSS